MNPYERETVINASDGDEVVRIWTAQRTMITKLRKLDAFKEVASGFYNKTEWAEFTIAAEDFRVTAKKSYTMSDEQRAKRAERMRQIHASR